MGYGNMPLTINGNNLVITTQNTDHTYEKFPSPANAVFNGKYTFNGNWDSKPPSVVFTPDGKFIDEGALNILNHQATDPDEFNITAKSGSGTYQIKNYTLVLIIPMEGSFKLSLQEMVLTEKIPPRLHLR